MPNIYSYYYRSPVGDLVLGSYEDSLCLCDWVEKDLCGTVLHRLQGRLAAGAIIEAPTELTRYAVAQLDEYFARKRAVFDIPLLFAGTEFQEKVWRQLLTIPYGSTISYLELARRIGNPKACRAVGGANNRNVISIFAPCHRVVGLRGDPVGYSGGVEVKKRLLELEANTLLTWL